MTIQEVIDFFAQQTEAGRVDLFRELENEYCRNCGVYQGDSDRYCQCDNDE